LRDRVPCEFFLVRYVPDVVKGEFVNIGVVLREAADAGVPVETRVRFTRDWSRVRCMDAGADLGLLEDLEQEIAQRLKSGPSVQEPKSVLAVLEDTLSNSVQLTGSRASLAENLTTELEQLMRLYVEPMQQPGRTGKVQRRAGRTAIYAAMRTEFERAQVWALMNKRLAAERYTRKGDPLRLDCGYRKVAGSEPAVRIFQAVSLEGDLEMARVLAFTAPQLREGVARIEGVTLELTAVVEPLRAITGDEAESEARYRFGVETMEQREIRVVTINDLARVAATARYELGL
jgi:hypothetical protein